MKPHIVETSDVLKEGSDLVAACGAKISKSRFIRLLESDFIPGEQSVIPAGVCRKCMKEPQSKGRRRVYLAVEGVE